MKYFTLAVAIITPAYLYMLIPHLSLTVANTVAIALISCLSVSIVAAIATLSRKGII